MRLFAVREIEDKSPVGFFRVDDVAQLMIAVDAYLNPGACEYKPIAKPAAIVWKEGDDQQEFWKMGVRDPAIEDDPKYLKAADRWRQVCGGVDFDHEMVHAFVAFLDGHEEVNGWKALCGDD